MRPAYGCIVFGLLFSLQTNAGGGNNNIPPKIVSGNGSIQKTQRERFKEVARQIEQLNNEVVEAVVTRAAQAEFQAMRRILPAWCFQIPPSILVYIGFDINDSDLVRGLKFIRLGFLVRDMYLDLPINRDVLLTYDVPERLRLEDQLRYKLVAGSFLQAYQTLGVLLDRENTDMVLSLANLASWSLHYLEASHEEASLEGFQIAMETLRYAGWAIENAHLDSAQREYINRLKALSIQSASKSLVPLFLLALQLATGQNLQ